MYKNIKQLREIALEKIKDAQVLFDKNKFNTSIYICGYAIEIILKAKICETLKWTEYLITNEYKSFKTHNLKVLLNLTGEKDKILKEYLYQWSNIYLLWNPEMRYNNIKYTKEQAQNMISYSKLIIKNI